MLDSGDVVKPFVGEVKHEFTYTWIIENFTSLGDDIVSEEFSINLMCSSKWNVILKTNDNNEMSIGLRRNDKSAHVVPVKCLFILRNSKGTTYAQRKLEDSFSLAGECKFSEKTFSRPSKFKNVVMNMGSNFRLCADDSLTVEGKIATESCCSTNEPMAGNVAEFQHDLLMSYRDSLFADVNFIIGTDFFPAHKFILAARSSVFRTMFEVDMKESSNNTIDITDIEKPVLEAFLTFLYSGVLNECDENIVLELYSVADKYDVPSLRDTCKHKLLSCIKDENVCTFLNLASLHNDDEFMNSTLNYLCDNFINVEQTEQWSKFANCNPILAAKVVCKFASILCNDKKSETY